jgi:hypothetical protein
MAVIYAYFDESGKMGDHPVVALAGICATETHLRAFDQDWNSLLTQYGWKALHMKEVMKRSKFSHNVRADTPKERAEALKPFVDCINNHLLLGIGQALDVAGFNALPKGTRAGLGNPTNPGYVAFARAILELIHFCQAGDRICLICDHDNETATHFFSHYKGIRRAHPTVQEMTISIAFADDRYFPALQAADMLAYLVRLEAKRRFFRDFYDYRPLLVYMIDEKPATSAMGWRLGWFDKPLLESMKSNADLVREREEELKKVAQSFSRV